MNFTKTENNENINKYRVELYTKLVAPIDAMWEQLHIGSSQHYLIDNDSNPIGYCCIDDEKNLKQIFIIDDFNYLMSNTIKTLIEKELITSASLSSNELVSFNACLFHSNSVKTNTFCFEYRDRPIGNETEMNVQHVSQEDISDVKAFFKNQIGFDDTFGYTENLVQRKELYLVKEDNTIIATSECRISDSQHEIADVGIIVNKAFQGKGIATRILKQQAKRAQKINRKPICSTTLGNIASRRAIEKAGFYCSNIIFDISFANKINKDETNRFRI